MLNCWPHLYAFSTVINGAGGIF